MTRDTSDVKRRIRSLLEVAKSGSGATEPERATARGLADRLMAAHGWSETDIPQREVEKRPPPPPPKFYIFVGANDGGLGGFGFGGNTSTTTGFSGF